MAAGTWTLFGSAKQDLTKGNIVIGTDTLVLVLVTSAYTPLANAHATWADVSANEASGTGYTAGGVVLTSVTDVLATGNVTVDSADVSWPASTVTAKYGVILKRASASLASTDHLFAYVDLNTGGGSVSTTAGTLTIAIANIMVFS